MQRLLKSGDKQNTISNVNCFPIAGDLLYCWLLISNYNTRTQQNTSEKNLNDRKLILLMSLADLYFTESTVGTNRRESLSRDRKETST